MEIIVGTAGHIDHGKTALVRALTGIDADRLPEEKRRGITIDIGFAELDLGDVRIGFVDVPGHEKFVKNMLAGAHGIDLVVLVIAANEGVMPQTREHFDICRLLEIRSGLIVLTKTDLVDEELLELVKLEAAELVRNSFLENAPVLAVSAKTGDGVSELKTALRRAAQNIPASQNESITRLPVDRVFTVKGFGTVVTGTLLSGEIAVGDELELLPVKKKVRVRKITTHVKQAERSSFIRRIGLNLGGIETGEIERGLLLASPGIMRPAQSIDVELKVLASASRSLKSRQRVRVHLGTLEALARLQIIGEAGEIPPGEKGFAQLRLESPVAAVPGEHFVIRSYSPQVTVAGGMILDNSASRHRRKDFETAHVWLAQMSAAITGRDKNSQLKLFLQTAREHGLSENDLQARTGWQSDVLRGALKELTVNSAADSSADSSIVDAGGIYLTREEFENLSAKTLEGIEAHHIKEPLSRGIPRQTLREKIFAHLPDEIFHKTLAELETRGRVVSEKDIVRAAGHGSQVSAADEALRSYLREIYRSAGLEVPALDTVLSEAAAKNAVSIDHARKVLQLLLDSGELIAATKELLFHRNALDDTIKKIAEYAAQTPGRLIDIAVFKELTGISRKYAIPLLEYFDRERITRRAGDKRLVL